MSERKKKRKLSQDVAGTLSAIGIVLTIVLRAFGALGWEWAVFGMVFVLVLVIVLTAINGNGIYATVLTWLGIAAFAVLLLVGLAKLWVVLFPLPWNVHVSITTCPEAGEGPLKTGPIAGRVEGLNDPSQYAVVIYAHTDYWYVQPTADDPLTPIDSDGEWHNFTHLGTEYATLLVKTPYTPISKTYKLPEKSGNVIKVTQSIAKPK